MFRLLRERDGDAWEVEALYDLCFAPGRGALSSYQLREGVEPVADLCTIARDEFDSVVGAIRYWPVLVGAGEWPALLLGPVAVHPTLQGEGLGALLITETLDLAKKAGWERVILVGDEPYYRRFGFRRDLALALDYPKPVNFNRLLARELVPGAMQGVAGLVHRWRD
ncbi:MAG: N-acetyltransferase [Thermohalobaculum sp.]|nr:N-acetyltransferase [Thermohalobaculum sp.]